MVPASSSVAGALSWAHIVFSTTPRYIYTYYNIMALKDDFEAAAEAAKGLPNGVTNDEKLVRAGVMISARSTVT